MTGGVRGGAAGSLPAPGGAGEQQRTAAASGMAAIAPARAHSSRQSTHADGSETHLRGDRRSNASTSHARPSRLARGIVTLQCTLPRQWPLILGRLQVAADGRDSGATPAASRLRSHIITPVTVNSAERCRVRNTRTCQIARRGCLRESSGSMRGAVAGQRLRQAVARRRCGRPPSRWSRSSSVRLAQLHAPDGAGLRVWLRLAASACTGSRSRRQEQAAATRPAALR